MNLWQSITGVVEVELSSADLPAALAAITELGVEISSLSWKDELTCCFQLQRSRLRTLEILLQKRGERFTVRQRYGVFWKLSAFRKRPVAVAGILFFLVLSLMLPNRILFVQAEGNELVPERKLLETAGKYGVAFGASRRALRSEKIKNSILSDIPELQWVGVNTAGCVATVSVRERNLENKNETEFPVSRIVAYTDGYILSGTVGQGTAMFQQGQTVIKGQTLISGYVDSGFCIRALRAEGEILAQTKHEITAVLPENCLVRDSRQAVKRKISLRIGKKLINLWKDSGISGVTCGRMDKEYYVTLPGGFRLPAALCVETYTLWDTDRSEIDQNHAAALLRSFARQYLQSQMIAGSIVTPSEQIKKSDGLLVLRGSYICEEMIGREQPEQIGVTDGKNN